MLYAIHTHTRYEYGSKLDNPDCDDDDIGGFRAHLLDLSHGVQPVSPFVRRVLMVRIDGR